MLNRRDFLQVAAAAATVAGGNLARAAARQTITQESLLRFQPLGQVTLLHFSDIHAQLRPIYFREPSVNIGVGEALGLPPHVTGQHFLNQFGIAAESPEAYALTPQDFTALARGYGRIGGLDRMATVVKAIRAQRPDKTLLLDGGDTWQGSYTSLKEKGADMVRAMNALGVEAMTGHWEFTFGAERVKELKDRLKFPFLCGNVKDATWGDEIFAHTAYFNRGGVKIAVIGQAFPYTPIANPRWLIPDWSFGIDEDTLRKRVAAARAEHAGLVVLLSHNGLDVDRKLAGRVKGIDVILTAHTHDALPVPLKVGDTLLIASGSHGKFLSRLDLEVKGRKVVNYRYRLIPLFADAIAPDAEMRELVRALRAPHEDELQRIAGQTDSLLYRRGNFNGTFDDLICQALMAERNAEIALSPGFRFGVTLLPGDDIRVEDIYTMTGITYANTYRTEMTGEFLKTVLEDVADNLFNPDPYYQQGGDMVRAGGISYTIDVRQTAGKRISDLRLVASGEAIEAGKSYSVAGWASVNEGTAGPPVHDVVHQYVASKKVVKLEETRRVNVLGADPRGMAT
jgi:S-sulfosulfanyl-L-cysteine sulfohydrolase